MKLWKKQETGIEFVKHYRAHLAPIVAVSASADGTLFASIAEDGTAKIFDVVNFGALYASSSFILFIFSLRYDQHDQFGVYTTSVLLGSPQRSSARTSCHVSALNDIIVSFIDPYQFRSDFWPPQVIRRARQWTSLKRHRKVAPIPCTRHDSEFFF